MKSKLPKGFKVTVHDCGHQMSDPVGRNQWFDCRVWRNGSLVLSTSGTAFEQREEARDCGVCRAWDIFNGANSWS